MSKLTILRGANRLGSFLSRPFTAVQTRTYSVCELLKKIFFYFFIF